MLLSHVAIGLGTKKIAPCVSLGTLVLASTFADLVLAVLSGMGIEHFRIVPGYTLMSPYEMSYTPYSHGLLTNVIIALFFAGSYFLLCKDRRSAIIIGLVVVSHWVLDVISHRPDMVLINTSFPRVGLELWSSFWGTLVVEIGLFAGGLGLYITATKARRKLAILPLMLLVLYAGFQFVGCFLITPPDTVTILMSISAVVIYFILPALAYWTDALRYAAGSRDNG